MITHYGRQVRTVRDAFKGTITVEQYISDSWCTKRVYDLEDTPNAADSADTYAGRLMNDLIIPYGRREE